MRDIPYLGAVLAASTPTYTIAFQTYADAHNDGASTNKIYLTLTNVANGFTVMAAMSRNSNSITNVTDSLGSTWTLSLAQTNSANRYTYLYYATNTSSGSNQIVVYLNANLTFWSARAYHFSGVQLGAPQDQQTGTTGTGGAAPYASSSGSITPGAGGELVFGHAMFDAGTIVPDTTAGWLDQQSLSTVSYPGTHYYIQTNAAAIISYITNTTTSSDPYTVAITSFKHR
jgi:hypothetical protein